MIPHVLLPAEAVFYIRIALLGVAVAAAAITWDRWYLKRFFIKTFVKELRREYALAALRKKED